jgi:hypothetical protein
MPKNFLKKIIMLLLVVALMTQLAAAYVASSTNYRLERDSINFGGGFSESGDYQLEDTFGEVGTGFATSSTFNLHAGYQQMDSGFISISVPDNIALSPAINAATGGQSNGEGEWRVTTDNPAGYTLSVRAATSPAMRAAEDNFSDYQSGLAVDYDWSLARSQSAFGFSVLGEDVAAQFKDNGSTCNTGVNISENKCWAGFSTTENVVARNFSPNQPLGTITTIRLRAEIGPDKSPAQRGGTYSAEIIATALPQ